ncbi:hypothetical protein SLS60_002099 [Paraconiothyrium brasiliense]|uniref:Uncharacterized protein n=1 Tax=Paraconiothyrium brasiliense TaxID=300254 RepID=A0ABR3S1D1_9PLEO
MAFDVPEPMFQGGYTSTNVAQQQNNNPIEEPFAPHLNSDAQSKPAINHNSQPRMGIDLKFRKPTREDYSNFVLYQGSQKVYEATFIRNFVAHALHPSQLQVCSSTGFDTDQNIHHYLRSVLDNVDKLATKMIHNTHSRIIEFMANDDRETIPFWDFKQFNEKSFADFLPGNTLSIVGLMSPSWHRAFSHPSMVRYSAPEYPVDADASPFVEIDDVTGHTSLFYDRSATHAAHNQIKHHPRTKKSKTCHLPGAVPRQDINVLRKDWLQGFGSYGVNESPAGPAGPHGILQDALVSDTSARGNSGAPGTQTNESGALDGVDDIFTTPGWNTYMGDGTETNSVCTIHFQANTPNCLESLVAAHRPGVLVQESSLCALPENTQSEAPGTMEPLWKMALIEDHKQRLAERWPRTQQQRETPLDFDGYIERAIMQGDLKRLAPGLRRIADFVDSSALESQLIPAPGSMHKAGPPPGRLGNDNADPRPELVLRRESKRAISTNESTRPKRPNKEASTSGPSKRRKSTQNVKQPNDLNTAQKASKQNLGTISSSSSDPAHADAYHGTSKTLENHQRLPPDAYFERVSEQEQPAWRCGIKHPMGYYYNAGDRKNCPGCFTALSENPKRKMMDFYLPSRSHFFQPAPGITWKPGRPQEKPRRSKHLSHNSIAKDAYWEAINTGATADEALKQGIIAVEAYLLAKEEKREKKEPTPEPTPEPVDLGPHSSGSKTMEHGQELPVGAYWKKQFRCDEFAWRCDINHALGRYYLAGDVRSCPGCGSCRSGPGKHPEMDFYLPAGSIARQEAPDLVKWKPRPPYKLAKKSKKAKQVATHNQFCSKKYWELINEGHEHLEGGANEEALTLAIKATDAHIDAKLAAQANSVELEPSKEAVSKAKGRGKPKSKQKDMPEAEGKSPVRHGRNRASLFSFASSPPLVPKTSGNEGLDDSELGEVTEYETEPDDESSQETILISSEDESTSDSDSFRVELVIVLEYDRAYDHGDGFERTMTDVAGEPGRVFSQSGGSFKYTSWELVLWVPHNLYLTDCKDPNGFTISSPSDVVELNKCTSVTGRITISDSAPRDIQLNGPKSLHTLQGTSAKTLRSISSSSLQSIDNIKLSGLPDLASLNFSALNTLNTLQLENLPALEDCSFGLGPQSIVKVSNTSLQSIDWLRWPVAASLNISSNENLVEVSLPWEVIEGAVKINGNPALEKVDVFSIQDVKGNFTLEGNDALKGLTFDKLESVEGNMLLSGTYDNVSMPVLKNIGGGLTIESTNNIQEFCDQLDEQELKAKYNCTSEAKKADVASASPAPSKGTDSVPKPSEGADEEDPGDDFTIGAKIGIITASAILGVFLVVGAVFFYRARSRGKVREIVISAPRPTSVPSVAASSVSRPQLGSTEAVVVGKGIKDVGGVRLVLNGDEMKEIEADEPRGRGELRRQEWRRSVSSAASEVPLIKKGPLT